MTMKTVCELVLIHSLTVFCFLTYRSTFSTASFMTNFGQKVTTGSNGGQKMSVLGSDGEGFCLSFTSILLILFHFRTVKLS